jgi:hypothetical protein
VAPCLGQLFLRLARTAMRAGVLRRRSFATRLSFRISRYGVTWIPMDFPRDYPLATCRQGGLPRYEPVCLRPLRSGEASSPYPTRNFAKTLTKSKRCTSILSADHALLVGIVPACRHAAGTISSPSVDEGVRRMASEDSDQFRSGLTVVHCLRDLSDLDQTSGRQMPA